jgi:lantibiotic modifying enzyme
LDRDYDSWEMTRTGESGPVRTVSLASGAAGVALFLGYHAVARGDARSRARAEQLLQASIDGLGQSQVSASLFCGFTGVAWVTDRLLALFGESWDDDPNAEIDAVLYDHLTRDSAALGEFDLIDGVVGVGVYALDRPTHTGAGRLLAPVVSILAEQLQSQVPRGRAIPTRRALVTRAGAELADGAFNCGMAHGQPGVIALLARIAREVPSLRETARTLLADVVDWQLAQQLPAPSSSVFPDFAGPAVEPAPARCAWCYGDPGVATALMAAAHASQRDDWWARARQILRAAAMRDPIEGSVQDAGLCHGSSGVALILMEAARVTSDPALNAAAHDWLNRILQARQAESGIAGWMTYSRERTIDGEWVEDPCFLTGAAGIGLTLLRAAGLTDADWTTPLLIGPRVRHD